MNTGAAPPPEPDLQGALEAARVRAAAGVDTVGWIVIEALARRAAAQQGLARQLMLQRVRQLLSAHAAAQAGVAAGAARPGATAGLSGLSGLVDRLGRSPSRSAQPAAAPPQALKAVTAFKGTWSRLRAEQRLRQALDQVPAMAGPLNSSNVVSRALQSLRELSPAYLDNFMAHVDTLLWLEHASGAGDLAPRPAKAPRARR